MPEWRGSPVDRIDLWSTFCCAAVDLCRTPDENAAAAEIRVTPRQPNQPFT
jgi:hypothetical protein